MAAIEVVGRVGEHHLRAHSERGAPGDAEVRELVRRRLLDEGSLVQRATGPGRRIPSAR